MAIKIMNNRFVAEQGKWFREYVVDGSSDIASLPTTDAAGSLAHYGDDGEIVVYELTPAGSWVQIV